MVYSSIKGPHYSENVFLAKAYFGKCLKENVNNSTPVGYSNFLLVCHNLTTIWIKKRCQMKYSKSRQSHTWANLVKTNKNLCLLKLQPLACFHLFIFWHFLFIFLIFILSCSRYNLKDVIIGKIYFLLVRIKIKHMELQIIKRESTGTGTSQLLEFAINNY